jgi:hypothetical protein
VQRTLAGSQPDWDILTALRAPDGLRYNACDVTALCSPTRAALLTGRTTLRSGSARSGSCPPDSPATRRSSRIGRDNGLPVDPSYAAMSPFAFTATLGKVVFDVAPALTEEDRHAMHEHEQHAALAHGIGA